MGESEVISKVHSMDDRIRRCTLCKLSQTRKNAVPGDGKTEHPQLMIVGEAPGRNEDLHGRPFIGAGGKLLDNILSLAGLERNQVYITNIVKCRPPNNRKPERDEIEICTKNYLENQIELIDPKLICTLGATAMQYFTGEKVMGEFHGRLMTAENGRKIFPTYHPASIFRNRALRDVLERDLKKLSEILKEL